MIQCSLVSLNVYIVNHGILFASIRVNIGIICKRLFRVIEDDD